MESYYLIKQGVTPSQASQPFNWIRLQSPSQEEINHAIERFQLPAESILSSHRPDEVARLESHQRGDQVFWELVVFTIHPEASLLMEKQIQPLAFVFSKDFLITSSYEDTQLLDQVMDKYKTQIDSIESFITCTLLHIYHRFIEQLDVLKLEIDALDQGARQSTSSQELYGLADTERELVYIDHTLKDQSFILNQLWKQEDFIKQINNTQLIYDVKLAQRHADKLVNLYRDLLASIGGLFSDIISHRLNLLMKFLNSAALIISIPTLISGIWGMNSAVPGQNTSQGFWLVIVFGAVLTLVSAIFLKFKDYSE